MVSRERFWSLIEEARAKRTAPTTDALFAALVTILAAGPMDQVVGFCRWLAAYNRALMRNDLRAACRVLLGSAEVDAFAPFRGWMIAQGEAFVSAAVSDPDAIAPTEPPRCGDMINLGMHVGARMRAQVPTADELPEIPDAATWPSDDAEVRGLRYTPELLHARLPRLTADKTDESLTGPYDPDTFAPNERAARAKRLGESAKLAAKSGEQAVARQLREDAERLVPKAAGPKKKKAAAAKEPPKPTRARHPKFGEGAIVTIEGQGDQERLTIEFSEGRKTVMRRFVELIE